VKRAWIVFKKEWLDVLRDRRTILMMVVIPLLIFPALMNLAARLTISQRQKAETRPLRLALIRADAAPELMRLLQGHGDLKLDPRVTTAAEAGARLRAGTLDFVLIPDADFAERVAAKGSGGLVLMYKSSEEIRIAKKRITDVVAVFEKTLVDNRLKGLGLEPGVVQAVAVREQDVATVKQRLGEAIGGFLPYIFVIFCFIGAMYPAIDLAAGEKERGTIETLLASPAGRGEIVLGKFAVVTLTGLASAAVSMVGLYLSIKLSRDIPGALLDAVFRIIEWKTILLVFSLLLPLAACFAALLLAVSIFARTFKEAQSIMTPLNFLVIFPVFIGLFPGITLDPLTAAVPVLNVSLATREIIAGTAAPLLLAETYLSLFAVAALSLWFCSRQFNREEIIFR